MLMQQRWPAVSWAALGGASPQVGGGDPSLFSTSGSPSRVLGPVLGSSVQEEYRESPAKGHRDALGTEASHTPGEAGRAGTVQPGGEEAQEGLIKGDKYLKRVVMKRELDFSVVPTDRPRGDGHTLKK